MSDHPYPDHVLQAVATTIAQQVLVMRKWDDLTKQTREAFLTDADEVLQALWDASRVDNAQEASQLPDQTLLINYAGCFLAESVRQHDFTDDEFPAHIVYWGDTDE